MEAEQKAAAAAKIAEMEASKKALVGATAETSAATAAEQEQAAKSAAEAAAKAAKDAEKVAAGAKLYGKNCEKCHDKNGSLADDDSGILAGQWLPYLEYSMQDFRADKRDMPKKMRKKVEKLDYSDIEALLQYFASQQ